MNKINFNPQELPSITEWLEKIKAPDVEEYREEDIKKFERLNILKKVIDLPYDAPVYLTVKDVIKKSDKVKDILRKRGNEICAMKLIPLEYGLPKFRLMNKTVKHGINTWFPNQVFDWKKYRVEILKHNNKMLYSSNFLINDFGIWGDIIKGVHWQLTQGMYSQSPLSFYSTDFHKWTYYTNEDSYPELDKYIKIIFNALSKLRVTNPKKQERLKKTLGAEFNHDGFIKGYFEFFVWPGMRLAYNDYNRVIYSKLKHLKPYISDSIVELKGIGANPGFVEGTIKIINDPKNQTINPGDIVVLEMINLDYLPIIRNCGGIIAELGNILSHITIVARELGKPCIVNVKNATTKLKNGNSVVMDATQGIILLKNP